MNNTKKRLLNPSHIKNSRKPLGKYRFSSTITDADPGSGNWRGNNANTPLATEIYISDTNRSGIDVSHFLDTLATGSKIAFQQASDSSIFYVFELSAAPVVATNYHKLLGVVTDNGTQISNNAECITFISGASSGSGVYLPLAGGTMTGDIDMGTNNISAASTVTATTSIQGGNLITGDGKVLGSASAGARGIFDDDLTVWNTLSGGSIIVQPDNNFLSLRTNAGTGVNRARLTLNNDTSGIVLTHDIDGDNDNLSVKDGGSFCSNTTTQYNRDGTDTFIVNKEILEAKAIQDAIVTDADTVLTETDGLLVAIGTTTQTITLPAANAVGAGKVQEMRFKSNKTSGTCVINRAGSDKIYPFGGSTAGTSLTLAFTVSYHMVSDGVDSWYVLG